MHINNTRSNWKDGEYVGLYVENDMSLICSPLQLNVVRLPEPYGNCTDTTERNIKRSVFEEVYPVGYSTGVGRQTDTTQNLG